jgi:DNA-3-methyladenine glycosylase II
MQEATEPQGTALVRAGIAREPTSPEAAHAFLVGAAAALSPPLRDELARIGPLWFPDREDRGLAVHLARAIVGQQLSTKAARSIWARIEAAGADQPLPMFLREENSAALRACGVSSNKLKALLSIGSAAAEGRLDATAVRTMDHQARSAHLRGIWGIGQWTCDMAAIFYCHDEDVWPAGDVSVQRTFAKFVGPLAPADAANRFAPYRSILALYMWRLLDETT